MQHCLSHCNAGKPLQGPHSVELCTLRHKSHVCCCIGRGAAAAAPRGAAGPPMRGRSFFIVIVKKVNDIFSCTARQRNELVQCGARYVCKVCHLPSLVLPLTTIVQNATVLLLY